MSLWAAKGNLRTLQNDIAAARNLPEPDRERWLRYVSYKHKFLAAGLPAPPFAMFLLSEGNALNRGAVK